MESAVDKACARIAPTWPLDRFIAVNPFWGCVDTPITSVAAALRGLSGAELLMPRAWFREVYRKGLVRDHHLELALADSASELSLGELKTLIESDEPAPLVRARVVDIADQGRDLGSEISWRTYVTNAISQFCAAYFDEGQALTSPDRTGGLYASWRRQALGDRGPGLTMGFGTFRRLAETLPASAEALFEPALDALEIGERERESYLWSLLLDQNGWASWCAYQRWGSKPGGAGDDIRDLLAIRLAWEWLLLRSHEEVRRGWRIALAAHTARGVDDRSRESDWILQAATEIAWQKPAIGSLRARLEEPRAAASAVQAVFCIDVRSEVFRRALEAVDPSVSTLGFAGFFGLPLEYLPRGAAEPRPHLPGLLSPSLRATDEGIAPELVRHEEAQAARDGVFQRLKRDAVATFDTVESLGVTYAWRLALETAGLERRPKVARRPRLVGTAEGAPLSVEARADLAEKMLRAMSLTHDFARLIVLVGHGSTTRNNPHAAGLDCGACCGQTGEVNARSAAALLDEADVRVALRERGIDVPATTWFVAALHDTTTDDVELFDREEVPETHRQELAALEARFREAGAAARAERATLLRLNPASPPAQLEREIRRRSSGWAQVRPEWGLANNAAFIVAPRERSRGVDLAGRAFLHEYRHEEDEGYGVLELIMTAPMVVAHWINFQYYASTVDNLRYGSGNKVLHNVVGGRVGVFEGNGGDLRIGLPLQSLHDGDRWIHTPLRLSVFIEAPRAAIDGILAKHAIVQCLVNHGWLSLFQLDDEERSVYAYHRGAWRREGATS